VSLSAPLAQLLSALVGGLPALTGGIAVQWVVARQSRRSERRNLAGAFAGELAALYSLMGQRRFLDRIDELIAEIERTGCVPPTVFSVRHHYFKVFDANAARLGLLEPPLPELLAHHYIYSKVFLEDMQDVAEKLTTLTPAAALTLLRSTRALVLEGLTRAPACLEEARRQAR
jgi:hypothetical protein